MKRWNGLVNDCPEMIKYSDKMSGMGWSQEMKTFRTNCNHKTSDLLKSNLRLYLSVNDMQSCKWSEAHVAFG